MSDVVLSNRIDVDSVARGQLSPDAVRRVRLNALVDTGAMTMVIPEDVADALGLSIVGHKRGVLADGTRREFTVRGPLWIEILGRQITLDAIVTPPGTQALIGQIPLEALDLLVDPVSREVRVRSEEEPVVSMMLAA